MGIVLVKNLVLTQETVLFFTPEEAGEGRLKGIKGKKTKKLTAITFFVKDEACIKAKRNIGVKTTIIKRESE